MPGSFIDMLPPEAQALLGGIALLTALVGLILWAAGVKIARFSVAVLLGAAGAALGSWLLPTLVGIAAVTGGLVGFVIGALAGALGFRLLQGLTLALCLGAAVGGTYYRWHILPALSHPSAATAQTLPIDEQLIHLDALPPGPSTSPVARRARHPAPLIAAVQSAAEHWNAIPSIHQKRLLIVSIATAAIALFIAFGFPRHTTWFITALLGALLLLAGINALLHVYAPQYESALPLRPHYRYLTLAVLTLLGMGVQRRFFWPHRAKAKSAPPSPPPPAAPQG